MSLDSQDIDSKREKQTDEHDQILLKNIVYGEEKTDKSVPDYPTNHNADAAIEQPTAYISAELTDPRQLSAIKNNNKRTKPKSCKEDNTSFINNILKKKSNAIKKRSTKTSKLAVIKNAQDKKRNLILNHNNILQT